MRKKDRYLIFDLETTGLELRGSAIVQIGFMVVDVYYNGKHVIKARDSTHCYPELSEVAWNSELVNKALSINKSSREFLKDKPKEKDVVNAFLRILREYSPNYIVGQNILAFDLPILCYRLDKIEKQSEDLKYVRFNHDIKFYDTKLLAFKAFKKGEIENHKLQTLATHFKIKNENAHNALSDVETTWKVFKKLKKKTNNFKGFNLNGALKWNNIPGFHTDYSKQDLVSIHPDAVFQPLHPSTPVYNHKF